MATLDRKLRWILPAACGIAVANLYYNQPLLEQMGASLHVMPRQIGLVATATQVGYAAGMLLFVPLGDVVPVRRLCVGLLVLVAATLAAIARATSLPWLVVASLAMGVATVSAQVLIPFAARLAPAAERGRVVGAMMSGLLLGILLARTVAGFVGEAWGWRAMFWLAAAMSLATAGLLAVVLPPVEAQHRMSYAALMKSLWDLTHRYPTLRQSALIGGAAFGAFSAFWTTLAFFLAAPPYHYGAKVAGAFGLVGAAGAAVAPLAGRMADRRGARFVVGIMLAVTLASFATYWQLGMHLWGLVVGVLLMDAGVQGTHVANQTRIFSLAPDAQGRMNTVYMICYFVGGSVGSLLGAWAWTHWRWPGVCAAGAAMTLLAYAAHRWGAGAATERPPRAAGPAAIAPPATP